MNFQLIHARLPKVQQKLIRLEGKPRARKTLAAAQHVERHRGTVVLIQPVAFDQILKQDRTLSAGSCPDQVMPLAGREDVGLQPSGHNH